jgi:hypothetical protein
MSKLSVAMQMTKGVGLRQFSDEDYKYDYTLRLTKHDARTQYMEGNLELLTEEYLKSEFSGPDKQSFSTYLKTLDDVLDQKGITGEGRFGNILVGFDVSVPSQVLGAWKNVPASADDMLYKEMSTKVQRLLRRWIPLCYLQEPQQYAFTDRIYPLLAYCSLPPINRVTLVGNTLKFTADKVHDWDYKDDKLRSALLQTQGAQKLSQEILPRIRQELSAVSQSPELYDDNKIGRIIELKPDSNQERSFEGLMITESQLITGIHHAAIDFRNFLDAGKFDVAVQSLAEFGVALTDTFNNRVGNTGYGAATLRPLGSLLFIEVSKLFDQTLAQTLQPAVMLEFLVLKNQSTFVMGDFLSGKRPDQTELALEQRIVSAGMSSL